MKNLVTSLLLGLMIIFLVSPYTNAATVIYPNTNSGTGLYPNTNAATGLYIGAGGSYAIENFDDIGIDFDNTWGINAKIGYHFDPLLDIEFNYDYLHKFEGDDSLSVGGTTVDVDVDIKVMTYIVALKGYFPFSTEESKLSVVAGVGLMYADFDIQGSVDEISASVSNDEIDGCAKLGLGLDYYLTQNFSAGLEGNYTFGFDDLKDIQYFNFTLGLAYHF